LKLQGRVAMLIESWFIIILSISGIDCQLSGMSGNLTMFIGGIAQDMPVQIAIAQDMPAHIVKEKIPC
jgi:hypothetical protein